MLVCPDSSARTWALRFAATLMVTFSCSACSSKNWDVAGWQMTEAAKRDAAMRGTVAEELQEVEKRRQQGRLAESRSLALALVAENGTDGRVLLAASKAESDAVFLFPKDDDRRSLAALSSLDYAERMAAAGEEGARPRSQLAWTLGTTIHLKSMGDRSAQATRTKEVAESVLTEDPDNTRAMATLAVLHLRLETLPWIASLMASGLPESSLEEAERLARRCVELAPSRENRIILAKVLLEMDKEKEARTVLEAALSAPETYPRDRALEPAVRKLLDDI